MRVKNVTDRPQTVDGGRTIPARSFGEANGRHPAVQAHLDAGRLVKPSKSRRDPVPLSDPPADVPTDEGDQA